MAILNFEYHSHMAFTTMNFIAIIPQREHRRSSDSPEILKSSFLEKYPVLYLLHSDFQTNSEYVRLTNLERFASEAGVAVILPEGLHSFWSDYVVRDISESDPALPFTRDFTENCYESLVYPELFDYVSAILPVSTKREETFIGGVGMGGFGALKIGLKNLEHFSGVFSICGYTDIQWMMDNCPDRREQFEAIFGGLTIKEGSENDFSALLENARKSGYTSRILLRYTEKDRVSVEMNRAFAKLLQTTGSACEIGVDSDDFDWNYIEKTLSDSIATLVK